MRHGFNSNVRRRGQTYHVQTQERSVPDAIVETLVYLDGQIVASITEPPIDRAESSDPGLRLRAQHERMIDEIRRGLLDVASRSGDGSPVPIEVRRRRLQAVLERLEKRIDQERARESTPDATAASARPRQPRVVLIAPRISAGRYLVLAVAIAGVLALATWYGSRTTTETASGPQRAVPIPRLPVVEEPWDRAQIPSTPKVSKSERAPELPPTENVDPTGSPQTVRHADPFADQPTPVPELSRSSSARVAIATESGREHPTPTEPSEQIVHSSLEPPAQVMQPPQEPEADIVATVEAAESDSTGQLFPFEEVDEPPWPLVRPLPQYTKRARRKNQAGTVELELLVDERGRVVDVVPAQTLPGSDLDDAAVATAKDWRFRPALKNGSPVQVWITTRITFRRTKELGEVVSIE